MIDKGLSENTFKSGMKEPDHITYLKNFLSNPARPEGTLSFPIIEGVVFALLCSPVKMQSNVILEMAFSGHDPNLKNANEKKILREKFSEFYNYINEGIKKGKPYLPSGYTMSPQNCLEAFQENHPLSQWAQGVIMGLNFTKEDWPEDLDKETDEALGANNLVLSLFANKNMAEKFYSRIIKKNISFEEFASNIYKSIPESMGYLATISKKISEKLHQNPEYQDE